MRLVVRQKPSNKKALRFPEDFSSRIPSAMRGFTEQVASDVHADVQTLAPWDEIEDYPDMLGLYSLPMTGSAVAVGILPPPRVFSKKLRSGDALKTLLWVKPKMKGGEAVSIAAVILADKNPWTMGTLPYVPQKREAEIISRRVSVREAMSVGVERVDDVPAVIAELKDAGFTVRPIEEIELGRRVTRDVMFEVARVEFGYDRQGSAHWRPALRRTPRHARVRGKAMFAWLTSDDPVYDSGVETKPGSLSSLKFIRRFQDMVR